MNDLTIRIRNRQRQAARQLDHLRSLRGKLPDFDDICRWRDLRNELMTTVHVLEHAQALEEVTYD